MLLKQRHRRGLEDSLPCFCPDPAAPSCVTEEPDKTQDKQMYKCLQELLFTFSSHHYWNLHVSPESISSLFAHMMFGMVRDDVESRDWVKYFFMLLIEGFPH